MQIASIIKMRCQIIFQICLTFIFKELILFNIFKYCYTLRAVVY